MQASSRASGEVIFLFTIIVSVIIKISVFTASVLAFTFLKIIYV